MGFLTNKKALVLGIANNRSIAYGIAEALHREGAELAFTYQSERLQPRAEKAAEEMQSSIVLPCDVASDESIQALFDNLKKHWDNVDIIIHSVAYAPSDQLAGDYVDCVSREGFQIAHDISSYSFVALAKTALPMLTSNAALLTLTYFGAEKAVPNYNVMGLAKASLEANVRYMAQSLGPKGIRVNAVSAGPVRTLAASGIHDFRKLQDDNARIVPLRRNITLEDVGNASAFLCSDLAAGITGEILHVDSGFHCIGLGERA